MTVNFIGFKAESFEFLSYIKARNYLIQSAVKL